jgi:glycosyltransferase involved in cell wall biosynthesis
VAVSQGVHDSLRRRDGGALAEKVVLARNGIPRLLDIEARAEGAAPFRIMYAGSFYHGRDPMPFLRGLAATMRRLSLGDGAVEVCFAGDCRWFRGQSVEEEVRRLGLERVVEFRDWIPHDECQRLVRAADMLLLLAQDQPLQIPNKLYEYLGTRRPILAFVDADGESAAMLHRVGGHHVLDGSSVAACEAALREAISRRETGRSAGSSRSEAETLLHSWTTRAQMDHLLASVSR